jgi:putative SOS response-associated peptidase YedK
MRSYKAAKLFPKLAGCIHLSLQLISKVIHSCQRKLNPTRAKYIMCTRYTLTRAEKEIQKVYEVKLKESFAPNYNLAPTQEGLVITADEPGIAQKMHFGLVPYWSADTKLNMSTLNARSEDILEKKTFRPLINNYKTCLVLADGFYEWDKKYGKSIPYRFVLKDRTLFAFAGLWSEWKNNNGSIVYRSFTILTTTANGTVKKIHDPKNRMPVILDNPDECLWLSKDIPPSELLNLCRPYPDEKMESFPVSTDVNAAVVKGLINNNPQLMMPLNSI